MQKLNAQELRESAPTAGELAKIVRREIYVVVDNVYDTYNVGAIFRLADSVGVKKVFLCGSTQTPPYHRIQKASVGTWKWVPWQYATTAVGAIANLKSQISNLKIVVVEQTKNSITYAKGDYALPVALVVGNESGGISAEVLKLADTVVEIPMYGVNRSLNVMASLAVVLYKAVEGNEKS